MDGVNAAAVACGPVAAICGIVKDQLSVDQTGEGLELAADVLVQMRPVQSQRAQPVTMTSRTAPPDRWSTSTAGTTTS